MKKCAITIAIALLAAAGCTKSTQPAANSCDPAISYKQTVQPVFIANCTSSGCHDGVDLPSLSEYTVARDAAQQIRTAVQNGIMPMNGSLSAKDKSAIICWIDNGAKNN